MNNFYYLGFEIFESADTSKILKIFILSFKTKSVHCIYKQYSKELVTKLDAKYKLFANCTDDITFVIKRDGKVALDIK